MKRSVDRDSRLAPRNWLSSGIVATVAAALGSQELRAQVPYELGPRALYPGARAPKGNDGVPLIMQDAVQSLVTGTRLLATKPRVVGGAPTPVGAYPWMASVQLRGGSSRTGHFCGGAFITPQWVITAAHCVYKDAAGKIQVLGQTNALDDGGNVHFVDRIVTHEKWDSDTHDYDVSLLRLTKSYTGRTIGLVTPSEAPKIANAGVLAIAMGWGLTSEGGQVSNLLRNVTVQLVSNKVCNGLGSYSGGITDQMICAGFPEGGKDSCQGDSGGPLVVPDQAGGFAQAGIVSFGEGCGRPNKFGVYTNVSVIQQWVSSKIGRSTAPAVSAGPLPSSFGGRM